MHLGDLKIVLLAQITRQLLAEGILEFDDLAAVLADEVVVSFCVPQFVVYEDSLHSTQVLPAYEMGSCESSTCFSLNSCPHNSTVSQLTPVSHQIQTGHLVQKAVNVKGRDLKDTFVHTLNSFGQSQTVSENQDGA